MAGALLICGGWVVVRCVARHASSSGSGTVCVGSISNGQCTITQCWQPMVVEVGKLFCRPAIAEARPVVWPGDTV